MTNNLVVAVIDFKDHRIETQVLSRVTDVTYNNASDLQLEFDLVGFNLYLALIYCVHLAPQRSIRLPQPVV